MFADVSTYINAGALGKILLLGLIAGAGLTAIYSFGVEALSRGGYGSEPEEGQSASARSPLESRRRRGVLPRGRGWRRLRRLCRAHQVAG